MGSGQMMPELGSRISLISKADIRYEGRLFTVDPQECTIALANVRSFGTEDRETAYPIMPQPTVYDYILFRGADIKDIRVVNNVPIPNDPAIMQMHLPPQQQPGFPPQQQMPPIQSGSMQFGPFSNLQQGPPVPSSTSIGGGQNIPQQQPSQQLLSPHQSSSQQGSRSGTPNQSRKSPTSDMGVQTFENQRASGGDQNKEKMQRNNQYHRNNNNNQHERRDSGRNDGGQQQDNRGGNYRQNFQNNRMQGQQQHHQQQQQHNKNPQQQNRGPPNRGYQGGSGRMRPPQNQHQNFPQNYRGGPNQGVPNRQIKPNGGPQKNQKTLKFENEFDFEKANSKFEELRSELSKLKVGEEEKTKPVEPQVKGEIEKKDDSGNETGADHDPQEVDDVQGYDKTKSFFDNISCEANERSKGKTQRTDWRQERKINTETFGLTMNRRGNFRGRGYYQYGNRNNYGRSMNNYRSGGGGGGMPMQYNNNRNRTQNGGGRSNNNNNNQGQQQQQSQNKPASTAAAGGEK